MEFASKSLEAYLQTGLTLFRMGFLGVAHGWGPPSLDIIAMIPIGTFGLCCIDIFKVMTYWGNYVIPFTLQLCYKPLGKLQRVTKSQKLIYQVMMDYKNFITSSLFDICYRVFQREKSSRNSPLP